MTPLQATLCRSASASRCKSPLPRPCWCDQAAAALHEPLDAPDSGLQTIEIIAMPGKVDVPYRMFGSSCGRIRALLRKAGLRPTFQRVALGRLLFADGDKHVTAEQLYHRATESNVHLSLATIYNTLRKF